MTFPTASDESTWTIRIGRTDAEFLVGTERGYDLDGYPFTYEYTYLAYDVQVDVRLERSGETPTYREALEQARGYVVAVSHTALVVQVNAGRRDGWSFIATGWLPNDEALSMLDSACAR